MIRRITVTGEDENLAQLYYNAYRKGCAKHQTRIGNTAVYTCHNVNQHAQFSGLVHSLDLKLVEDQDIAPPWTRIAEAILEDEQLAQGQPFTCRRITELTGILRPSQHMNHLVEQGFLTASGKKRGHRYRLARATAPMETP